MTKTKRQLSPGAKAAVGVGAIAQVLFAFLAFWDLSHRDSDEIRGPKPAWIPVILVNWIGPTTYFMFGIRR